MADLSVVPAEAPDGLALALVASSATPLLLLRGDMRVVAASRSFCDNFDIHITRSSSLYSIGHGEWDVPQLRVLLKATLRGAAAVPSYAMDLVREGREARHLLINARKLDYADEGDSRLLVAISDVTEAQEDEKRIAETIRDRDDRLQRNGVLMNEMGSRIANSLQIIASILLQSAQQVVSDESRRHLYDAHNRVMSVASVQKHLEVTSGSVSLATYLTGLCESLAASMIREPKRMSLVTEIDTATVSAETSVSLGLIVTELVINGLKHAYPGRRAGRIVVAYKTEGEAWTLSVADDGVGMPTPPATVKPGLGASIIEALARKLGAKVVISPANPGTRVSIVFG